MKANKSRRSFIKTSVGNTVAASGFSFLGQLPSVSAAEAMASKVQMRPEIEPLVRLLEDTPRDRIIEEIADRIRKGLSYREVLTALLLAGVRNVEPRPAVGFKFHAVLVVNSAHLASVSGPDSDRWLPILWAISDFKKSQARDVEEGDWTMAPVAEKLVPPPHLAKKAFIEAMDRWDEEAADAAVAGLSRSAGAHEIFELFAPYAARDMRSIGHKAIYLANAWRALQVMGWEHAEPVLRSLAYALLNYHGEPNPDQNDLEQDRPWKRNEALAREIGPDWKLGKIDRGATCDLMSTFRDGSPAEASDHVAKQLNAGTAPQSIIDALFVGASELMLRQPNIPALHAVTTTNALHFLYQTCADDATRRRLLLQNAAFLPLFREFMHDRGKVGDVRLDTLEVTDGGVGTVEDVIEGSGLESARKVMGYATDEVRAREVIDAIRRRIFLKGTDAHHYKFSSAVLEDYYRVSPEWRGRLLACSPQYLPSGKVNPLVQQVREAFG